MKQKIKGISLIVLVITIIIIIILAGAVILSLSNSNVINKAKAGVMQTDIATVKEKIRINMAENELNGINTKIGTQLWDSYYTLSVSQLQEIGITTKNEYLYDYKTGRLSIKQNNEYVTPEELYGRDSAKKYIDGYVNLNFGSEAVTDAKISAATDLTIKASLQKTQLAQKNGNNGIKVNIYDVNLIDMLYEDDIAAFKKIKEDPKYTTETTNNGYFMLDNITVEQEKTYSIVISNFENTLWLVKTINLNNYINKTLFTKASPLKLYLGEFYDDLMLDGSDNGHWWSGSVDVNNIRKYDLNKDGKVEAVLGSKDSNILVENMGIDFDSYNYTFN